MEPKTSAKEKPLPAGGDDDLLEPGEHILTEVRRHTIGIAAIYIEAVLAIAAIVAVAIFAGKAVEDNVSGQARDLVLGAAVLVIALVVLIVMAAVYVYRQSRMFVTDRSLVQVLQRGLFNRKVSRLSMSNVEDVSADQAGLLPSMFDYGTLTVQTAGERDNFIFPWCPKPNHFAERILEARQAYADNLRDEARE